MSDILLPAPVAVWDEPPTSGVALPISRLVPFKTAAGYWVLLPPSAAPGGATQGAVTDSGAGYVFLDSSTTTGKRLTRGPAGVVFIHE